MRQKRKQSEMDAAFLMRCRLGIDAVSRRIELLLAVLLQKGAAWRIDVVRQSSERWTVAKTYGPRGARSWDTG